VAPPRDRNQSKSSQAHFYLAAALANLGQLNEAQAAAVAGLAINPTTQSTASALARRAIIQRFLLSANAFTRACKWPGA